MNKNINNHNILNSLKNIGTGTILVAGDVMLDSYWYGATSRISPEAPVPVVKVNNSESRPGGSANVAMNIGSLGVNCSMVAITGNDDLSTELENHLKIFSITPKFQKIKDKKTISKLRVISQHQQLIRIDHEDNFANEDRKEIEHFFEESLSKADVAVISDYAKGTIDSAEKWIKKAVQKNIPVIVDPKGSNFDKYKNATIITPNFNEFEQVVGKCNSEEEIINKALSLISRLNLKYFLITRGEKGMTLVSQKGENITIAAQSKEIFDVTGAGDTVVAALAVCFAANIDIISSVKIANYAAGIVVTKLGTAFTDKDEIKAAILQDIKRKTPDLEKGMVSLDILLKNIAHAKKNGEKIVMTNGCFDLLHPGHIDYLKKAKKLGDRLIVAVNTDESVKRLKGSSRPINPVESRMQILEELECTDWIIPFEEDTPRALIAKILPDILVKGSDYKVEEIAGSKEVIENGGEVILIDYLDGFSTSSIIENIKKN